MKIRVVRDADVDYGWRMSENRSLIFRERFYKVYGVPCYMVKRMWHDVEKRADFLEYDDAADERA